MASGRARARTGVARWSANARVDEVDQQVLKGRPVAISGERHHDAVTCENGPVFAKPDCPLRGVGSFPGDGALRYPISSTSPWMVAPPFIVVAPSFTVVRDDCQLFPGTVGDERLSAPWPCHRSMIWSP